MGRVKERSTDGGRVRYTACYLDIRGRERSAGTFSRKKDAERAWQRAEAKVAEGRVGDPRRGRQTFERYVREEWLPNHVMELRTRENYTYYLERVILPEFGPMKMVEILPSHIREWVNKFQNGLLDTTGSRKKGQRRQVSNDPSVIQYCMVILSAIFTTALNDQVTFLHPCKGVDTPPVPKKARKIITPEQFDALYQALPDEDVRLLVETDIETGARWGELIELRGRDLNRVTRVLTVSRVAVELSKPFQVDGQRFVIKHYPKDGEERQFRVSKQMVAKIVAHIERNDLQPDDLLFAIRDATSLSRPRLRAVPDADTLGLTEPNHAGRQYRHGTMTAYQSAKCRCQHCRDAYAIYRAQRRSKGLDPSPPMPKATSPAPGSAPTCGSQPGKPQDSEPAYGSTTSGTPTPPGCWPEAPTSRPSRNASATAAS